MTKSMNRKQPILKLLLAATASVVLLASVLHAVTQSNNLTAFPASPNKLTPQIPARLSIPVMWDLTRSHINRAHSVTETESYRETWTLEQSDQAGIFLTSDHARVPVYSFQQINRNTTPTQIAIRKKDVIALLGLSEQALPEAQESTIEDELLTLSLTNESDSKINLSISSSELDHLGIHLEVGE